MTTLVEFLRARLDEDEQAARAAEHANDPSTLEWRVAGSRHLRFDNGRSESYAAVFCGDWDRVLVARDHVHGGPVAAHIARHDPARTLREVEAKRRIVELHQPLRQPAECWSCRSGDRGVPWPCQTLRALASIWSQHPDYREEWRP